MISSCVSAPVTMMPVAIVAATAVEANAPAKFITAARASAARGDSARVETEVATAFAVSWKPFVKSKASASTTTPTRSTWLLNRRSPALQLDRVDDDGGALARVD